MATRGKNKLKCKAYKDAKTREKNKKRKIMKHLKKHVNDLQSSGVLKKLG